MQTRAPVVIGRGEELSALERALGGALAGDGGALFLVGEAGIGKSRLARVASGSAFDLGMRVLRGRGSTIGPLVPFRALTEALMSLLRGGDGPDPALLGPYQGALGRLVPEWAGESDEGRSLVVLAEAVLRLLAVAGRSRACLLVLEDLHDADAETLAVVDYLVDNLAGSPVLLLVTARPEPSPALDVLRLAAQRGAGELLEPRRLTEPQVREMAASCLETSPDRLPDEVAKRLWNDSAGIPFVVEEMLHGMVSGGLLVPGSDGWRVVGELRIGVPTALVRAIAHRTDRLGPRGRELLSAAAVLGHRFSLTVLRRITGLDDRALLGHLHAGVAAQLVTPDEPAPDWYAFRHPLTAEALLARLAPAERAELSRRAADAVEALHPGLPGEWCPLVASLRLDAGDRARAGALLAEAGRRALADGAVGSAVRLLDHAHRLLSGPLDAEVRADVLESLLPALGEAGQFERAFALVGPLAELGPRLDRVRWARLCTRLARVAYLAGRWELGNAQVDEARALLGADGPVAEVALVDSVAASLALQSPGPDRVERARELALRAAERSPDPVVRCEARQLLGILARERDVDEATDHFVTAQRIAEEHRLPVQRSYAVVRRAGLAWLADAATGGLLRARAEALGVGAIFVACNVDAILALDAVLRGRYAEADELVERCAEDTARFQLLGISGYVLMTRATAAAHRGRRAEMVAALERFDAVGGAGAQERPLCFGLARAFCALLEEDRGLAARELAVAEELELASPSTFHLSGTHGLRLLLGALDGGVDLAGCAGVVGGAVGGMRWNRVFGGYALAVLLGRAGRGDEALAAFASARAAGEVFPLADGLGLRLAAEAAVRDGWGAPVGWLREAEERFHGAGASAVASACRGLLRAAGAPVQQRRSGSDLVPGELRALGVTVREFEVFRLVGVRLGNKAIAHRLHISPRTVEKHVASLLSKTGRGDREGLSSFAAGLGG
ncbi:MULTISPECIES: AAA family ATPase [Actinosynnema]|uniref:ATP-binding protein n=1 Tax=Actinosynnema TaxID=40566 RepID=UPI0026467A9D|nr:LuxR family transcriptional regulator [Actinosynnema pretiosum]MCP2098286.1 regulatory protein, luxR family [Actinosynnema pretiosum]